MTMKRLKLGKDATIKHKTKAWLLTNYQKAT